MMASTQVHARKGNLLVVDDSPVKAFGLATRLRKEGYTVREAANGYIALDAVREELPDLILLDIDMPGMNGYEVCGQLKADEDTRRIPVIFISALEQAIDKVKAFEVGGADYVSMPFQFAELLMRVENQLHICRMQEQLLELNAELEERVRVRTGQLEQEITERKQAQEKLLHMAMHDSLTGLPNRAHVIDCLGHNLAQASQDPSYQFAVLFIDCDQFKVVNDSLGHLVGDQLIGAVAHRLEACIQGTGFLGRLGGDEFLIVLIHVRGPQSVSNEADRIQQAMALPFKIGPHEMFLSASIGIVMGRGYTQPDDLLRDADTAMYRAKSMGRGRYKFFEDGMHHQALTRLHLENDLRRALERDEFEVNYQPIVSLRTGLIVGFESLLRWQHPERGMVSPANFIAMAEETGLIIQVGQWVLRQSCKQLRQWQAYHPQLPLYISVNLSVRQFSQPNLVGHIDMILRETGLSSDCLKLEITESAVMDNPARANEVLSQLRARRIQLSIDDFGTGYSSLSYLHKFPINTLKIDGSFIRNMGADLQSTGIVGAIIALADNLGMEVVAEGIETESQLARLTTLGCEYGQGYFFSRPLDADRAEHLIASLSLPKVS